jgi:hypothetical protein
MRFDVRRIGQVKIGDEPVGGRTRVKIAKNKFLPTADLRIVRSGSRFLATAWRRGRSPSDLRPSGLAGPAGHSLVGSVALRSPRLELLRRTGGRTTIEASITAFVPHGIASDHGVRHLPSQPPTRKGCSTRDTSATSPGTIARGNIRRLGSSSRLNGDGATLGM